MRAGRTHTNSNAYGNSNANTYTDADPMHWEMFTHAEAAPDFGGATHSAASSDTAADAFMVAPSSCTAANSAASPHTTTDAYRLGAPNSGTAPVSGYHRGRDSALLCPNAAAQRPLSRAYRRHELRAISLIENLQNRGGKFLTVDLPA